MSYGYIYKITTSCSEKVYIGQTTRNNGFKGRYNAKSKVFKKKE